MDVQTVEDGPASSRPPAASYCRWSEGHLLSPDGEPSKLAEQIHAALRAVVLDPEYPCVGARAAINRGSYRFSLYDELDSPEATEGLGADLARFAKEAPTLGDEFTTFIASFDGPKNVTPEDFERLLWSQLHRLHQVDPADWDPTVSKDPSDGRFSFSFGGEAFFIVGLSPTGARWGRRFPWPTLAFNPHAQFERLRSDGRFQRLQETVRARDLQLEGDLNPNLADFGDHTEARQYSGRAVEDDWRCPVTFD